MHIENLLWDKNAWGLLTVLVLLLFGFISIVFAYHWKRYGEDLPIIKVGSFLYIIGSIFIITSIFLVFEKLPL